MTTLLFIDDEETTLNGYSRSMKRFNYTVHTATNGEEGIRIYQETKPDLVFVDILILGMNGFDIFKKLRKIDPSVKVCFLSGSEHELERLQHMGFHDVQYLTKPVFADTIKAMVESTVSSAG